MNYWLNVADNRRRFLAGSVCSATTLAVSRSGHAAPRKPLALQELDRVSIHSALPRRITVDEDGIVWLAAGKSVQQLGADGKPIWNTELTRTARCLCVDHQGVFVGVRDYVVRYDRQSHASQRLPSIGTGHLVGDVFVNGDSLIATDITTGRVLQLDLNNAELQWSETRSPSGSVSPAGRIAPSARGGFAITDPARHRVVMMDQRGDVQRVWGKRSRKINGFQGCCNPMAAIELSDGSWVTAEAGQVRIKRFDSAGRFITQIAGPESIDSPAVLAEEDLSLGCGLGGIDLAVSSSDDLWVLHASAKELIRYRSV